MEWQDFTYCHGTAHGFGSVEAENTILSSPIKPLTAADLFEQGSRWADRLKEHLWKTLTQSGWRAPENQPDAKQQLESNFAEPDRWLFTKEGLQIDFDAYDGGCYACTPQPITLPWAELKPLLSKSAIVPQALGDQPPSGRCIQLRARTEPLAAVIRIIVRQVRDEASTGPG